MTISPGDTLPDATLLTMGPDGPQPVRMADRAGTGRVVIFGLPGAFTRTCTAAHLPSFMRTRDAFAEAGVDRVLCVSVNDPFVMKAWGESTGATDAGIELLGDSSAEFTKAIGMEFTAEPAGFIDRSKRYSMFVEDGVVKVLNPEPPGGECEISGGETLLEQIRNL